MLCQEHIELCRSQSVTGTREEDGAATQKRKIVSATHKAIQQVQQLCVWGVGGWGDEVLCRARLSSCTMVTEYSIWELDW